MITAPFSVGALKNGAFSYSGSPAFRLATAARFSTRLVEAVFSSPARLRNDRSGVRATTAGPHELTKPRHGSASLQADVSKGTPPTARVPCPPAEHSRGWLLASSTIR